MFKLLDGRQALWQWDLDRHLVVEDPNICEVHFCNRTSDCSLVVEVKDGLAAIPNIILQEARPIRVYAYVDDKYTLTEEQFAVKSRTRPADYVYTETEVKSYQLLDERITALENTGVDLSNYYNKTETDNAIKEAVGNISMPDTSNFVTMDAVEAKGYQTEAQVNTLINDALGVIENGTY